MKKILICQLDHSYFLNESLSLLERHTPSLIDLDVTVFCQEDQLKELSSFGLPHIKIIHSLHEIANIEFDLLFNLTIFSTEKNLVNNIQAKIKKGTYLSKDDWSTYALTLKEKSNFLNLHLQDIYSGILGLPKTLITSNPMPIRRVVFGNYRPEILSFSEMTNLASEIKKSYPHLVIQNINEINFLESHQDTLYFGPQSLQAIKIVEAGARSIFAGTQFTGMNLMPYSTDSLYITSHGEALTSNRIIPYFHYAMSPQTSVPHNSYSCYKTEISSAGLYLNPLNHSDFLFACYQSFFTLWSYLLGFNEVSLSFARLNTQQSEQFRNLHSCVDKVTQLAKISLQQSAVIVREFDKDESDIKVIQKALTKIRQIEMSLDHFAVTQTWFNPFYSFYKQRFTQIDATQPVVSGQEHYILMSEFVQSLEALSELFVMTLIKNEASI